MLTVAMYGVEDRGLCGLLTRGGRQVGGYGLQQGTWGDERAALWLAVLWCGFGGPHLYVFLSFFLSFYLG